jgi:thymidylate synthase (FAD)
MKECTNQVSHRPFAPGLEPYLNQTTNVLDHGFIRVVDYMGTEQCIVDAARTSYQRGTERKQEDPKLIRYLMRHQHGTPFEMCEIKFHVKLPIFVARQWIRHRTASVNEASARYSILSKEFYIPSEDQLAVQSATNRQGRGEVLEGAQAKRVLTLLQHDAELCYQHYEEMLNDPSSHDYEPALQSLSRELARMNLPVNFYTQWYWKVDLRNLMHFLALRADSHAQYEIRVYAQEMLKVLEAWLPNVYQAFIDYEMEAYKVSAQGKKVLRKMTQLLERNDQLTTLINETIPDRREREEFLLQFGLNMQ